MIQVLDLVEWARGLHGIRATSHTRLRAHDQYTLSTLIGGKGRVNPSSPHMTLEGPTEYVDAMDVKSTWLLVLFSKTISWR